MDPRSPAAVPGGGKLRLERHCHTDKFLSADRPLGKISF
jgi:hypothetical protein